MDTIRTLYCDSENAQERADKSFVLDIPGGVSVAEGARTFIDAVSFTNVFSEKVSDANDELYVRTLTNKTLLDPSDASFNWSYSGTPFDRTLEGTYDVEMRRSLASLEEYSWQDSTGNPCFLANKGDLKYEWVLNGAHEKLFVFDALGNFATGKATVAGSVVPWTLEDRTLTVGTLVLTAARNVNTTSSEKFPLRNLAGAWTRSDGVTVTVAKLLNKFHFSWTTATESGIFLVRGMAGEEQGIWI